MVDYYIFIALSKKNILQTSDFLGIFTVLGQWTLFVTIKCVIAWYEGVAYNDAKSQDGSRSATVSVVI